MGMGYKKRFPDPSNILAEAKQNKKNRNEPLTRDVDEQLSEE
jgi:hypothetical protein